MLQGYSEEKGKKGEQGKKKKKKFYKCIRIKCIQHLCVFVVIGI